MASSKVSSLLMLMSSAVIAAFGITALMVYQYGPSGQYLAKNTLLSPLLVPALAFNDANTKTGGQSRFVFEKINYIYFDIDQQKPLEIVIPLQKYEQFYSTIQSEKSISNPTEEIISLFEKGNPARLTLIAHTESSASWQVESKIFQEVQFANEGNFFRIALRADQNPNDRWAYYHHPNIKQQVQTLFVATP